MTVELMNGDCLELLERVPSGYVLITDPPYGVGLGVNKDMRGGRHGLAKQSYDDYEDTYQNLVDVIVPRLTLALRQARRGAVFCGPHIQDMPKGATLGGVYCPAGSGRHRWGFNVFMPILFYGVAPNLHEGAQHNVFKSSATAEENGHPCPKPLEWMIWLVKLATRQGDTVVDPFMGSGTTGVACVRTNRNFIGIEKEPSYFEIARKRIDDEQADIESTLFYQTEKQAPPKPVQPTLFAG